MKFHGTGASDEAASPARSQHRLFLLGLQSFILLLDMNILLFDSLWIPLQPLLIFDNHIIAVNSGLDV